MVRLCNWDNRPSLGGFSMVPSHAEMIERKKSTIRYHLRKMQAATSNVERKMWEGAAQQDIRDHNRMVREYEKTLRSVR